MVPNLFGNILSFLSNTKYHHHFPQILVRHYKRNRTWSPRQEGATLLLVIRWIFKMDRSFQQYVNVYLLIYSITPLLIISILLCSKNLYLDGITWYHIVKRQIGLEFCSDIDLSIGDQFYLELVRAHFQKICCAIWNKTSRYQMQINIENRWSVLMEGPVRWPILTIDISWPCLVIVYLSLASDTNSEELVHVCWHLMWITDTGDPLSTTHASWE